MVDRRVLVSAWAVSGGAGDLGGLVSPFFASAGQWETDFSAVKETSGGSPGMAVDYKGHIAYDPSQNVLLLVEAAVKRLDDLRIAETKRLDEQLRTHVEFTKELFATEAKRLDAIRAVDVGAVAVASERATQQAAVLAGQVTQSADTLRTLVATTATTFASQSAQLQTQLTDRLALLERAQYESQGRSGLSSPLLATVVGVIAAVVASFATFLIQRALKI